MKPRIKPLRKTGDSTAFDVTVNGKTKRVVITGCMQAAYADKTLFSLLALEIGRLN
jgi:hypothetical protein